MNKKTTAITLSVVSSIILASIGFEIINSRTETSEVHEKHSNSRRQLKLTSDYFDEIALSDNQFQTDDSDAATLQYLHRQQDQKAKKIQELTRELNETNARLQELKSNIIIRGGEKEREYQKKIEALEIQLKNTEQESLNLKETLKAREALIENKREELENLSKIFTQTHASLEKSLEEAEAKIRKEQEQINLFILQLQEKMSLNAQDAVKFENLEQLLEQVNNHIAGMESQLTSAIQNKEIETTRSDELKAALDEMQKNYEISQTKINTLEEQYNEADKKSKELIDQLQTSQKSTSKMANDIAEAKNIRKQLEDQEAHVRNLERQLSLANGYYKIEQQRAAELENALKKCNGISSAASEGSQVEVSDLEDKLRYAEEKNRKLIELINRSQPGAGSHLRQCAILSTQQDKLIQDLEKNLAALERKNKELESQLSKMKAAHYSSDEESSNETVIDELKARLRQSEDRIKDLTAQLSSVNAEGSAAEQTKSKTDLKNTLNDETHQIIKELILKQQELREEIIHLKKAQQESSEDAAKKQKTEATPPPPVPSNNADIIEQFDEFFKGEEYPVSPSSEPNTSSAQISTQQPIAYVESTQHQTTLSPAKGTQKPLTDKEKEALKKLQEKQERVSSLEKRLQKLQASLGDQSDDRNAEEANPSSEIFKAKIAYLTTRLAQEKMKLAKAQSEFDHFTP